MGRYTPAYSNFVYRLKEVQSLQKLAKDYSGIKKSESDKSRALCRSGVVLLCSHLEGHLDELTDVILENIVHHSLEKNILPAEFFFYFSRDIIHEISQTEHPEKVTKKVRKLLTRDQDIWSDEKFFNDSLSKDRFMSNFSTPNHDKTRSLINRFGYGAYEYDLKKTLKSQYYSCTNMVNQLVIQRNKIAHGSHVTTATHSDLENMIDLTKLYCRTTDQAVANWFSLNKCSIR